MILLSPSSSPTPARAATDRTVGERSRDDFALESFAGPSISFIGLNGGFHLGMRKGRDSIIPWEWVWKWEGGEAARLGRFIYTQFLLDYFQ